MFCHIVRLKSLQSYSCDLRHCNRYLHYNAWAAGSQSMNSLPSTVKNEALEKPSNGFEVYF